MAARSSSGVNRRTLFSSSGALVAAGAVRSARSAAEHRPSDAAPSYVTAVEGTNIASRASPDGRHIAFDLYAGLWIVPIEGGPARRVALDDFHEITQPDWFPDGETLAFQSYRDGNFHIWTVRADGSDPRQLTTGSFDDREPRVSPDGKRISFSSDRGGRYGVHILDLASGTITEIEAGPGDVCEPAWSPDGRALAVSVDKRRIEIVPLGGAPRQIVADIQPSAERNVNTLVSSPAFTPDGRAVIYTAIENGKAELRTGAGQMVVAGEDVFPFRVSWLPSGEFLYAADGAIRRRSPAGGPARAIAFSATVPVAKPRYRRKNRDFESSAPRPVLGIGAPALSPDGRSIVFRALNDIYLMRIGERARPLIQDGYHKLDPAWSPDGRFLVFSIDRGGKLDLWIKDLDGGAERQLTHFADAALSPAWSRDGRTIAFLSQNGGLHLVDVASGAIRRLYDDLWEPGKPSWSPDGQTFVMAAFKPYSARFREGLSEILAVDVATGVGHYQPVRPHRSLGTRGDDGPVWSPDGTRLAFVFASRLWTVEVDGAGMMRGEPKPITDEVTDAPTWSGDSSQLLYLSAGQLRLISSGGGAARTIPHGLTWTAARPKGRLVIAAGRLWDGTGPEVRRDMEIVVEGSRIAGVVPRGAGPTDADARRIDASSSMVIPGLIDMHTHRQMQGYAYGAREGRLWLSLGVTATRSPGGPAYHTVEDQEAIESGARPGPRYYATGEAIDGSRIYYNFMRPVTEPGQMALELARAEALNYDLIKTYVRLAPEPQKAVIAWAHARGLHVTSHYHYPALAFGGDGMEHMGATSRTGYSRSVSALGSVYQDVNAAFLATGAPRTPTLFLAQALLGEDRSLVDDCRIKTLYPPWEYARLDARARQLAGQDRSARMDALKRQVAAIRETVRVGGRIVTGADSPIDFNAVSLHMNLRSMTWFGLTPMRRCSRRLDSRANIWTSRSAWSALAPMRTLPSSMASPWRGSRTPPRWSWRSRTGRPTRSTTCCSPFAAHQAMAALAPTLSARPSRQFWWRRPAWLEQARSTCCDGGCGPGGRV